MNPESYDGRAVRTSGRLDFGSGLGRYVLRDVGVGAVDLLPVPEVAGDVDTLLRELLGRRAHCRWWAASASATRAPRASPPPRA